VFQYTTNLMNNAIDHCFVPKRWNHVNNIMLEKSPGNPYLPKLRIIQITEKDENLLMGILFGRRLTQYGEMISAFGNEQGGSRADRQTGEISLYKHFMYSISRTTITDLASFDNDAKSCYDRIVMTVASLAAQRIGITQSACELLIKTLQSHKHHISTHYGESKEFFTTTASNPIHGPGQGGKCSSAIWMIISTLLMECMENKSDGAIFSDPHNQQVVQQRMTGFVDDTTHWINNDIRQVTTGDNIITKMSNAAQYWEQLLHASGGKLELTKCFFYHMKWNFDSEGVPTLGEIDDQHRTTTITDSGTNTDIQINAVSCHQSHRTLGIMESPSGNNLDEYQRLLDKAQSMARRIAMASLTKHDASILYYTMYLPALTYPLTVGTQSLTQTEKIQSPVTHAILPKLGYNRHFPLEVAYGPQDLGGIGLRHLFTEQGTIKAIILLKQLRINRPLGQLSHIKLSWDQRIAGTGHPILEAPFYPCPQLQHEMWTTTLREFLHISELEIHIPNFITPSPKRHHDVILMDTFHQRLHQKFTDTDIQMINRCRIYLKAETLADIVNMEGTQIQIAALNCSPEGRLANDTLWPLQKQPGNKHIKQWQRFIRLFTKTESLYLKTPLGSWIHPTSSQQWVAYKHRHNNTAMIYIDNDWKQYTTLPLTRTGYPIFEQIPHDDDWLDNRLATHQIADMSRNASNKIYIKCYNNEYVPLIIPPPEPATFNEYLSTIPTWESDLLQNVRFRIPVEQFKNILIDKDTQLCIVSDGGNIESFGSHAWVIANDFITFIENNGTAYGSPMSSYRAEAYGKLSWILFLKHCKLFYNLDVKCNISSYCDNKSIVQQTSTSTNHQFASISMKPDYDILIAIQKEQDIIQSFGYLVSNTLHVKGHQDKIKPYHELPRPAQLNIDADKLASEALTHIMATSSPPPSSANPHCHAYLRNNKLLVSSNEQTLLRWKWAEFRIQQYYARKFKIRIKQLHYINWAGLRLARNQLSHAEKRFNIKLTTNWLPINEKCFRSGKVITLCHRCNDPESITHIFQCNKNKEQRQQYIDQIASVLTENQTAPDIHTAIIYGLYQWLNLPTTTAIPPSMIKCYNAQSNLGWNLFARGMLVIQWCEHQQEFARSRSDELAALIGDTWNKKLSLALIRQAHKLWIARCNEIHQKSSDTATTEITAQLQKIYDQASHLPPSQRPAFFHKPISQHIKAGISHMTSWVSRNINPVKRMVSKATRITPGQITITKFFKSRTTTNTKEIAQPTTQSAATSLA
jgi:hypothetical protein